MLRPIKKPLKSIPLEQNCTKQQIKAVVQISEQAERKRERARKREGAGNSKEIKTVKRDRGKECKT